MFTNTYFSIESSRRFLTARTRSPYTQPLYVDLDQHVAYKNLINLNRESISETRGYVSVDSSIPFTDYLRNLSESLSRTARYSSHDLKADDSKQRKVDSPSLPSDVSQKCDEKMSISDLDKQRDTVSKVNMFNEHATYSGVDHYKRLEQSYSSRDVFQDPFRDISLPMNGICQTHKYDRLPRRVTSTVIGRMSYATNQACYPIHYFNHQQIDPGRCSGVRESLGPRQRCSSSYSNENSSYSNVNSSSSFLDCRLSHLTSATQQTVDARYHPEDPNVFYVKGDNSDLLHQPFGLSSVLQHCNRPETSDRCLLPQDLSDMSVAHSANKSHHLKKYKCEVCHKAFSRSNTLLTHKRIHTGDKPFICDICGRAFRQPGNLTRHRLTHSPYKPFVCPVCRKAFNRASNLSTHVKTHVVYDANSRHTQGVKLPLHQRLHPAPLW